MDLPSLKESSLGTETRNYYTILYTINIKKSKSFSSFLKEHLSFSLTVQQIHDSPPAMGEVSEKWDKVLAQGPLSRLILTSEWVHL